MGSRVFVVDGERGLRPLELSEFPTEQQLDSYIERYPELLASALSSDEKPLRFILVETQAGIDDLATNATGRWAADAMFLDQDGVLTIVEDKLARNAEIRRKIVGQMIEYAANVLVTFTPDGLLQRLRNRYGDDVDEMLARLLQLPVDEPDIESAIDEFWARVEQNLQAGRIRMVFATDQMPPELGRIIEFLSQYMRPMTVFGVTLKRLLDGAIADGREILMTSTIGARTEVPPTVVSGQGRNELLTLDEFLQACEAASNAESAVAKTTVRLIKNLRSAECPTLGMRCERTPGGEPLCIVKRLPTGDYLFNVRVDSTKGVRFNLGKKEKCRETLTRLAGYNVPTHGRIDDWCAANDRNEQQFQKWVIDAASRDVAG
jgi:hypothetical protein